MPPKISKPVGRRTIQSFPSLARQRQPAFYAHMFIEDLQSGVMGSYRMKRSEDRQIKVEGRASAVAAIEKLCASLARSSTYSARRTIESAVEAVALHLAWSGTAFYEICASDGEEYLLASVPPDRLIHIPGAYVQIVPKADRRWNAGRRYTILPSRFSWVVRIPRSLGGAKRYRRLLEAMKQLSPGGPGFFTRDLEAGKLNSELPFKDYVALQTAAVARLTRRWGWNRRDSSGAFETEYFYFYRSMRLRCAQSILRNHIISEINKLAARLEIAAQVVLEGYTSPGRIRELIEEARSGRLHYAKAFELAG